MKYRQKMKKAGGGGGERGGERRRKGKKRSRLPYGIGRDEYIYIYSCGRR
jgi:hypothetical protein